MHNASSNRREFLATSAVGGMAALFPNGESTQQLSGIKLGRGAEVLDVPENRALLRQAEAAKALTPEQLLRLATLYRDGPATQMLAHHLAFVGMSMLAGSRNVNAAMAKIGDTEIEWSWWKDAWRAVKDFFTPGPISDCTIKCVLSTVLMEKCGDGKWHVIGICFGGSF